MCGVALLWWMLYPERANSGSYLNSAHSGYGVTTGVKRSASLAPNFPSDYAAGLCAHCHEQHASIKGVEPEPAGGAASNYLLFRDIVTAGSVQSEMFCYSCHGRNNLPVQDLGDQWNYSRMAGGYTSITCPNTVRQAFQHLNDAGNPRASWCGSSNGSAHYLKDIRTLLSGQTWGYGGVVANIDPCSGCHNPHRAQYDPHTSIGRIGVDGKLVSSVSLPSQHSKDNNVWELWGDDTTERMSYYAGGRYQAPYATSNYEPDGSLTTNGLNLVDYVTLCTDCHTSTNASIYSTPLGRNLYKINWANEMHGGYAATYCSVNVPPPTSLLAAPYDGINKCGQYVLSCTDCHEPHGSPNNFLVRKWVNNGFNDCSYQCVVFGPTPLPVTVTNYGVGNGPDGRCNKEWVYLCGKCHTGLNANGLGPHHQTFITDKITNCCICHSQLCSGGCSYDPCNNCHFHGNNVIPGYGVWDKPLF